MLPLLLLLLLLLPLLLLPPLLTSASASFQTSPPFHAPRLCARSCDVLSVGPVWRGHWTFALELNS